MTDLPDLAHKVGPLPLGVWLAGGVGGLLLYEYNKRKTASATTAGTTTATAVPSVDTSGAGYATAGNPGATGTTGTTTTGTTAPTTLTDNNAWYQKVFQDLVGRGYQPTLVDGALQRYLGGQQLSTADWAIINAALADAPIPQPVGATTQQPPSTVPPVTPPKAPTTTTGLLPPTQASPPPKQATQAQVNAYLQEIAKLAKTRPTTYIVKQGDSLATIAAKYYANPALWANLYNANRNVITNPNVLIVGTKITLPASPYA